MEWNGVVYEQCIAINQSISQCHVEDDERMGDKRTRPKVYMHEFNQTE